MIRNPFLVEIDEAAHEAWFAGCAVGIASVHVRPGGGRCEIGIGIDVIIEHVHRRGSVGGEGGDIVSEDGGGGRRDTVKSGNRLERMVSISSMASWGL